MDSININIGGEQVIAIEVNGMWHVRHSKPTDEGALLTSGYVSPQRFFSQLHLWLYDEKEFDI